MRRAGCKQAHANDMLLLRRLLPQAGEIGVPRLEIAGYGQHEEHQQDGDHRQTDPGADDMQVEQMPFQRAVQVKRPIVQRQQPRA